MATAKKQKMFFPAMNLRSFVSKKWREHHQIQQILQQHRHSKTRKLTHETVDLSGGGLLDIFGHAMNITGQGGKNPKLTTLKTLHTLSAQKPHKE